MAATEMTTTEAVRESAAVVKNTQEWLSELNRLAGRRTPSFFHARAQLPEQGRTNQVLGATPLMNVVLKTYASGGENELHAHTNEDHMFFILQGRAMFFGPNEEQRELARNDCVLIPHGSYYWFRAVEGEPLVMLRIGATLDQEADPLARVGIDMLPLDGFSEANKELPVVLSEHWFE
jgi:mannose-6-phosphate isomerase-like protein (cupin superfamily)